MVVRKSKKVNKYRASTTHGGGHRKKRRGAGSRGGRGMAGSGKRAGQKKAGIGDTLGKKGFSSHHKSKVGLGVSLSYFSSKALEKLVASKKASKEGGIYTVDLKKLGYGKLLGSGFIDDKVNFSCAKFTAKAEAKVKAAGGSITVA